MKDVKTLPGTDIDSDCHLLVAKICARLKQIIGFQQKKPNGIWRSCMLNNRKCKLLWEKKLGATDCESGNIEVHWKNQEMCGRYYEWFGLESQEESNGPITQENDQ